MFVVQGKNWIITGVTENRPLRTPSLDSNDEHVGFSISRQCNDEEHLRFNVIRRSSRLGA